MIDGHMTNIEDKLNKTIEELATDNIIILYIGVNLDETIDDVHIKSKSSPLAVSAQDNLTKSSIKFCKYSSKSSTGIFTKSKKDLGASGQYRVFGSMYTGT